MRSLEEIYNGTNLKIDHLKEILGNEEYRNLIDRETAYKQRIEERRKKKERDTD